jgi:hypothetical protein
LNDFSDYGHGGAIAMPENQVFIGIEPYNFSFSIIPSYERLQWLFNHELTHVTMGDKPNKTDESWRKVFFGKIRHTEKAPITALWSYLTVPDGLHHGGIMKELHAYGNMDVGWSRKSNG